MPAVTTVADSNNRGAPADCEASSTAVTPIGMTTSDTTLHVVRLADLHPGCG
jgi:hypothetical protein